jgi:hypothetical protein
MSFNEVTRQALLPQTFPLMVPSKQDKKIWATEVVEPEALDKA